MWEQVETVLNKKVRPQLALHNGGVKLLKVENGVVYLRLIGQCSNCPASYITTQQLIFSELSASLPEIKDVIVDHSLSEDLMNLARKLLGRP